MTIGLVMPVGEFRGGVERMLVNLLRANGSGAGVRYHVAFLEDGPLVESVRALGYPVTVIPAGRLRDARAFLRTRRELGEWIDQVRPAAILSWAAKGHLYVGGPARRREVPVAWYVHGLPGRFWMDRLVTAIPADLVLCCSRGAEAAQQALRPARETRVVPIAVDLSEFDPDELPTPADSRRRLGLPPEGPIVTMVARLQHWKGVHVFIAAAARLAARDDSPTFVVVGGDHASEPGYRDQLEAQIAETGLGKRIRLVGLQSNIPLWMQAADVVVHASFDEPAGAVVIEGMALGKAVVAARTAGPMEFVTEGETGRLTVPGDDLALASVLGELLEDPEQRRRLGQAARLRASAFGSARLAENVAAAMSDIAGRGRLRAAA